MLVFFLILANLVILFWALAVTFLAQVKRSDLVTELQGQPPTPRAKTLALWLWWQICGGGLLIILMCATPMIDTHTSNPWLLVLSWLPEAGFLLFHRLIPRHLNDLELQPPSFWEGKPLPSHWQP